MKLIDDEWARVSQNPDNMLVSDSLKESIESLISRPDASSVPARMLFASLRSTTVFIQMELFRVEQSSKGWALVGSASVADAVKVLQTSREAWNEIVILQDDGAEVWSRALGGGDVRIDIDFPAGDTMNTSTITLGFTDQSVQTRVL
jgi:hypothetical protein